MTRIPRLTQLALWMILAALVPGIASAAEISPVPLWKLTSEAELIVVAEVSAIEELPRTERSSNSASAQLSILETLKGPELVTVEVPYAARVICPQPPRYAEGETVVAFLAQHRGAWRTVGISHGALYPQGSELDDIKVMIEAALPLQQQQKQNQTQPQPEVLEGQRRDWLVRAATLPGTRWHGLYGLAPGNDPIRALHEWPARSIPAGLSEEQWEVLADGFVETPRMDPTFAMMAWMLKDHEDPEVDEVALGVVEGLLALEELPWWTQDVLWATLARFGDDGPQARLDKLGWYSWEVTPDQLRGLWAEAKKELGVPEVEPETIELETSLLVGGQWPG
ncbi:MAG: hypothetical protein AAGD01_08305 [Acidobacteriota bacterium]